MTPEQRDELRRLEANATLLPWRASFSEVICVEAETLNFGFVIATIGEESDCRDDDGEFDDEELAQLKHDATYIAAACNNVVPLLDEIDRLEHERAEILAIANVGKFFRLKSAVKDYINADGALRGEAYRELCATFDSIDGRLPDYGWPHFYDVLLKKYNALLALSEPSDAEVEQFANKLYFELTNPDESNDP